MRKARKGDKGFTLIEVIISLAILGIMAIPLSSMLFMTMKTNQQTREILIANQLAQGYMERIKASNNPYLEPMNIIDAGTALQIITEVSNKESAAFNTPAEDYDVIFEIRGLDGVMKVYDNKGDFLGFLDLKEQGTINTFIRMDLDKLIIGDEGKDKVHVNVQVEDEVIKIRVLNVDDKKINIHMDNPFSRIIHFYTEPQQISEKNIDIKGNKINVFLMEENVSQTISILSKITVVIKDKSGSKELARLVSLKRIN